MVGEVVVGASVVAGAWVVLVVPVVVVVRGRVVVVRGGSGEMIETGGTRVAGGEVVREGRRGAVGSTEGDGTTKGDGSTKVAGAAALEVGSVVVRSSTASSTVGAVGSVDVVVGARASWLVDRPSAANTASPTPRASTSAPRRGDRAGVGAKWAGMCQRVSRTGLVLATNELWISGPFPLRYP